VEYLTAAVYQLDDLVGGVSTRTALFVLAFLCASSIFLFASLLLSPALRTRARIAEQLRVAGIDSGRVLSAGQERQRIEANEFIADYYEKLEKGDPDSIQARLYRAGFYRSGALQTFYALRIVLAGLVFFGLFIGARVLFPSVPIIVLFVPALLYSLLFLVLPGIYLSRLASRREESCRRAFPDFMDMMVVCADAGMSLEAAVDKVASELLFTHRTLGIHLKIMNLEVRAGRPLREALNALSKRLALAEAKTLATLFKQSEELGSSLTQTLRVYSAEMRERRIIAAEERANALPVKMVLPLGFCVFPVMLVMILLPVWVRIAKVFL
jgi:tight adherence protein C